MPQSPRPQRGTHHGPILSTPTARLAGAGQGVLPLSGSQDRVVALLTPRAAAISRSSAPAWDAPAPDEVLSSAGVRAHSAVHEVQGYTDTLLTGHSPKAS